MKIADGVRCRNSYSREEIQGIAIYSSVTESAATDGYIVVKRK